MLRIEGGNRNEWEFEYTANKLAVGAIEQKAFREGRLQFWKDAKEKVMAEIREKGIEISDSMAADTKYLSNNTMGMQPQVMVNVDLQRKLAECANKIQHHGQKVAEYEGWIQILMANEEARLKLTQADWLFFFGKI